MSLYETQVESEEYFWNGQKRHMLQNAVHPVQELCAVKTQADQHKTQTGKELTYDQYVNLLLLSAASAYDAQFAPKTHFAARTPCRAVYSHDITESSDGNDPAYDIDCALGIVQPKSTHFAARTPRHVVYSHNIKESNDDNDPAYDIDCALDIIQANGRPPGTSSMALSQWTQFLSQDAKDIWDKLPQTRQKTFSLNSRVSRCGINQDPGDWYLMAAYARHHLLPFGNYDMLYYFWRLVPDGSAYARHHLLPFGN
jgi:hypothetical protein